MSAHSILDQIVPISAAAVPFVFEAEETLTASAGRSALAKLLAKVSGYFRRTRDQPNEISRPEFASHGL